ncbi:recombinase family protein [Bacillus wiedmannii]|uniref:recombinase family protein n=1 Tax=Bacillus wiedmannii TaxID=1890302 RepID=UPI0020D1FDA2|nr:recombinase family protein [Bacillus wiedmannii]MCU5706524.1 recombinase family protein [Bacillus wiedmannii]
MRRVLTNEVHLGKVVYEKTCGGGNKNKLNFSAPKIKDKSEWIIAEGKHRPLKNEEEHQYILAILQSRKLCKKGHEQIFRCFQG